MIYQINNLTENTSNYVCPDQATIDQGKALEYTGVFSIGTEIDAQNILAANRQSWLTASENRFCVVKQTVVSNGVQWVPVDLDTQPDNTDFIYEVMNTPNSNYLQEIGLTQAKATLNQVQQNYLDWSGLASYNSWETWPTK
jgi:hypothetical protein